MAEQRQIPLSNRKSRAVIDDDSAPGWSLGRFLGGALSGAVLCSVLFVASTFVIPPQQVTSDAGAAAPTVIDETEEITAEAETVVEDVVEAEVPEEVSSAPDAPDTRTSLELSPTPNPETPAVEGEGEQLAIATQPVQTEQPVATPQPSSDVKAWQVHRAAFNASAEMPLIAILLEAPNETEIPVDAILGLGIPFTMAVIPRDEASAAFSQKARAAGLEVVAHLPMADTGSPAGDAVIREGLSEQEVRVLTQDLLALVPEAIGVSNFGGSAVTPNREVMAAVLAELNRKGHAFVDVRVGVDGAGMAVARDLGTPAIRNTLTLQPDTSEDEVYQLIDGAARDATTLGEVVILAKTSAPVLLGISRWALERNGKDARLAPLTAIIERRN
ncbi:MAG: divergent polysaccharide deacetylase family protein [Pseudomonadota bacterium]